MKMTGKVTIVTGATSGIGLACAEEFAANGSDLVLMARRKDRLDEISINLEKKYKVEVLSIQCDVRNRDEVNAAVGSFEGKWQNIDVLVNNAGLASGLSKIHEGDYTDWEAMIDTNIKGLLYMSRAVLPRMVERSTGVVINIGSIAGKEVYPNGNVYCATKHAVRALSQSMNIDLNGTGVRVTDIQPGLVETEFSEVRFHGDKQRAEGVYKGYTPLSGKDIAEIALFAATRPKHVNIQELMVTPTAQATVTIVDKK